MNLYKNFNSIPIFLSIENSADLCSISIGDGSIFFYDEIRSKTLTSEYILYIINNLLEKKKCSLNNIDCFILGNGPGNSTGIRLALSILQGLSLGKATPIIEISSLSAIALEVFFTYNLSSFLIILDAKFNNIYYNLYTLKDNWFSHLSYDNHYELISLNKFSLLNKDIFTIINAPYTLTNILNKNIKNIKTDIFPKAVYLDVLARTKMFKKNLKSLIDLGSFNPIENFYKKYKI